MRTNILRLRGIRGDDCSELFYKHRFEFSEVATEVLRHVVGDFRVALPRIKQILILGTNKYEEACYRFSFDQLRVRMNETVVSPALEIDLVSSDVDEGVREDGGDLLEELV
jgi:hypothetical protein